MLTESGLGNSEEFIEAELSKVEEHMLQMLEDMNRDIIWVNRTQNGIVPGELNILKNYYSDIEAFHILESLVRKGCWTGWTTAYCYSARAVADTSHPSYNPALAAGK